MIDTANVKFELIQVRDGWEYKGKMNIDDVAFSYRIKFGVHIEELNKMPEEKLTSEYGRELLQISVNDAKEKPVSLDDKMWGLFLVTVGRFAFDFYEQTRDCQEG